VPWLVGPFEAVTEFIRVDIRNVYFLAEGVMIEC
jgi:hypothetical protein